MTKEVRKRVFAIYVAINCLDLSRGAGAVLTDRGAAVIQVTLNICHGQMFSVTAYTAVKNLKRQLISFASIKIFDNIGGFENGY